MGWFSKKVEKTTVEVLQERSSNIVNVFTKTVEELQDVNQEVGESVEILTETREQINRDIGSLNELRMKNEKIIFNIQKIME